MLDFAYAQAAPGFSGPGQILSFLPLVLIFVVFYFLLIRPQQKKAKQHQDMLAKLKKNDEVMTSGGIYGKVVALADNVVTVEVAPNVRIRINRPNIAEITSAKAPAKEG
jgi:preprotein translocase subunit YajC